MKKIGIYTGLFLLGLLAWMIYWTPDLIVCRHVPMKKLPKNEWVFGRVNRNTGELKKLTFITGAGFGWGGLAMVCWAPSLFLVIAGSYISYYVGQRQMKEKMEKDFPYAADLSMKSAILAREKEDFETDKKKLNDKCKSFENEKEKFNWEKGKLELSVSFYKDRSEEQEKIIEADRRDHNNRKDKMNNLETKLKKSEQDRMACEKDKLVLEREKLDFYAEIIELKSRLKLYEANNKS